MIIRSRLDPRRPWCEVRALQGGDSHAPRVPVREVPSPAVPRRWPPTSRPATLAGGVASWMRVDQLEDLRARLRPAATPQSVALPRRNRILHLLVLARFANGSSDGTRYFKEITRVLQVRRAEAGEKRRTQSHRARGGCSQALFSLFRLSAVARRAHRPWSIPRRSD